MSAASAPRERRRQARGVVTRAKLLRCAAELIAKHGYERTSMTELALRAGVGTGTLYHHFPDRRAILLDLIDEWGDRVATARRSELDLAAILGDDPRTALASMLRRAHARVQQGSSLYLTVLGLLDRDAEVRRRYERIEQLGAERLAALIEFGQRRGLLRREPEPISAAFMILNAIDALATQVLVRKAPGRDPERALAELTDMVCRYLVEDERR
jgi:TetR/AcrR family transcriptional regulator, transcriptional repressor of aconitase